MGIVSRVIVQAAVDKGQDIIDAERARPPDPMRWVRRGIFLAALVGGWLFILGMNKFYVSPPTVFLCLAYLAVLATLVTLWRTGAAVGADGELDDGDDSTWANPLGQRGELEREKKALLKAIKEAEFDREMGKLSKQDAEQMIATYRARAIEVIKELDRLDGVGPNAGTVREQIERELKARLEIETKAKKAAVKGADEAVSKKDRKAAKASKAADAKSKATPSDAKSEAADAKSEATPADAKSQADDAKADDATAEAASADAAPADDPTDDAAVTAATTDGTAKEARP